VDYSQSEELPPGDMLVLIVRCRVLYITQVRGPTGAAYGHNVSSPECLLRQLNPRKFKHGRQHIHDPSEAFECAYSAIWRGGYR
jgi:hypothetical protein